jgi:glycosyltransferase involved in cell wall biosynthesis
LKIGIISTLEQGIWGGGCDQLWLKAAEDALADGHQVAISLTHGPETVSRTKHLATAGVELFWRKQKRTIYWRLRKWLISRLRKSNWRAPAFIGELWRSRSSEIRKIFEWKPDVIIVNLSLIYDCYYLPNLAEELAKYNIPYVTVNHAASEYWLPDNAMRHTTKRVLLDAKAALFVAEGTRRMVERHISCYLENAAIVRFPVNVGNNVLPMPVADNPEFAFVGRLENSSKGLDLLFEALSSDEWKCRNWRLTLYGKGVDKDYLDELARLYCIADRIVFAGYSTDIESIWKNAHILVLPSRTESAPAVLVEAMLCGRPAVVTDVGGVIEWAFEPETAFIADATTTSSIGAAMERAWQAKDNWEAMGIAAHKFAAERIDPTPGRTLVNLAIQLSREE